MTDQQRLQTQDAFPGKAALEESVLLELSNPRWDYRTADGIARKLKADKAVVKNILQNSTLVLKSVMNKKTDQPLYTLRSRTNRLADYIAAIRAASTYKLGT